MRGWIGAEGGMVRAEGAGVWDVMSRGAAVGRTARKGIQGEHRHRRTDGDLPCQLGHVQKHTPRRRRYTTITMCP